MTNIIGENIRRLRRLHEITQETLAEAMNVTIAAVSKWERGECLPDVTMLVPLAAYFGVTTDELLGVREETRRQKIQAWYDRYKPVMYKETKESSQSHFDELLQLMREYPNDFELLSAYIVFAVLDPEFWGQPDQTEKSRKKNYRKIEDACLKIIEKCTDESKRQTAFSALAELYASVGELEKGEKLITENVPFDLRHTMLSALYASVEHPETPRKYQYSMYFQFKALLDSMISYIEWVEPAEKKLDLCRRCLTMLEAFGGEDPGEWSFMIAHVYFRMCLYAAGAGQTDDAVDYAGKCLSYTREYDGLPKDCVFRDGFMAGHPRVIVDEAMSMAEMTEVQWMLDIFDTRAWAAPLREREDFRALLDAYRNLT